MSKCWRNNNKLREDKNDERVAVYVGTYGKYNNGSIEGKWMYPADYDSLDDFMDACYELHSDEDDPELMFQDTENLPDSLYSESDFSEEAFDFAVWAEDSYNDIDAAKAYISIFGDWDESDFEEKYRGQFDSDEDFCWEFINGCGGISEAVRDASVYFDYNNFGSDIKMDLDEEDEWQKELLEMDDYDAAEKYIDEVYGGIEELAEASPDTVENYFDISSYARDVMIGDAVEEDGYYFWNY